MLGLGVVVRRAAAPSSRSCASTPTPSRPVCRRSPRPSNKPPRDATLALVGDTVGVRAAVNGLTIDQAALKARLLAALAHWQRFQGAAPLMTLAPTVSTAAAQAASTQAAVYLSAPLRLRYRQHEVDLSPAQMATMLSVTSGADADSSPLTFDNSRGAPRSARLFSFVETPGRERDRRGQGQEGR